MKLLADLRDADQHTTEGVFTFFRSNDWYRRLSWLSPLSAGTGPYFAGHIMAKTRPVMSPKATPSMMSMSIGRRCVPNQM